MSSEINQDNLEKLKKVERTVGIAYIFGNIITFIMENTELCIILTILTVVLIVVGFTKLSEKIKNAK